MFVDLDVYDANVGFRSDGQLVAFDW
jgi:hypothetical protein